MIKELQDYLIIQSLYAEKHMRANCWLPVCTLSPCASAILLVVRTSNTYMAETMEHSFEWYAVRVWSYIQTNDYRSDLGFNIPECHNCVSLQYMASCGRGRLNGLLCAFYPARTCCNAAVKLSKSNFLVSFNKLFYNVWYTNVHV